jgi:hypothetical protein
MIFMGRGTCSRNRAGRVEEFAGLVGGADNSVASWSADLLLNGNPAQLHRDSGARVPHGATISMIRVVAAAVVCALGVASLLAAVMSVPK